MQGEIMIIDDRSDNLHNLITMLSAVGHTVLAFWDGKSALEAAAKKPPEIILLGIQMPGLDGFTVCQRLKADPGLKQIPVIFLTALNEVDDKLRAFAQGGADYVSKPFASEEVLARVAAHLRMYRLLRASEIHQQETEQLVRERTLELERKNAQLAEQTKKLKESMIAMDVLIRKVREDGQAMADEALRGLCAEILPLVNRLEGMMATEESLHGEPGQVVAEIRTRLARFAPDPMADLEQRVNGNLSHREIEIVRLLVEGNSSDQIAKRLEISSRSVDSHSYNIRKKIGVPAKVRLRNHLVQLITP